MDRGRQRVTTEAVGAGAGGLSTATQPHSFGRGSATRTAVDRIFYRSQVHGKVGEHIGLMNQNRSPRVDLTPGRTPAALPGLGSALAAACRVKFPAEASIQAGRPTVPSRAWRQRHQPARDIKEARRAARCRRSNDELAKDTGESRHARRVEGEGRDKLVEWTSSASGVRWPTALVKEW